MKHLAAISLGLLSITACGVIGGAKVDASIGSSDALRVDKRAFEITDFYRCAGVGAPALSKDGARVAFDVKSYDFEARKSSTVIWMMNADGSALRAMTSGTHADTNPSFSPDGRSLLFVSDRSGTSQLWLMPIDGGEAKALTDFAPGVADPVWSPDGKYIAVSSDVFPECGADASCNTKISSAMEKSKLKVHVADDLLYRHWTSWRDGLRTHILLVDAETGRIVKDMTPGKFESPTFTLGGGRGYAFSPDGAELCYVSNHDANEAESTNADLWIVPVEGDADAARTVNVTDANNGWDGAPLYSPDGRSIAYISQETPGYESDLRRLAIYDRATKKTRYLTTTANFDDWVLDMRWSADSQSIVFQGDRHGRTPLFKLATAGGKPEELLTHSLIAGWELLPAGDGVVYTRRSIHEPAEVFRGVFAGAKRERLTSFNRAIEEEVDIRPAEELWLDGDGDYKVHCFLVKPHDFDPSKKYPLILNVHGGPQGNWADAFRGDWQVYPGKGYIVAFCNPTGSTGYGQAFCDAITGDWGGRVYRDLMKVTDQLEKLPYVDKDRMGAMGWSYGGYMMMWMQGHTTRFKCLASMMGLFDLSSAYGETEELWFPEHDFKGTPWTSKEYERWSPKNHVASFKTPSLVISGEKDYRVSYTQSLQYFTALKKQNVPARLIIFPNAGHWPAWYEMAFYYNAHLDFFHKWLGGEEAPWDVTEYSRNLGFEKSADKP